MVFAVKVLAAAAECCLSLWMLNNEGGDARPPELQTEGNRGCLGDEVTALEQNIRVSTQGGEMGPPGRAHKRERRATTVNSLGQRAHPGDVSDTRRLQIAQH